MFGDAHGGRRGLRRVRGRPGGPFEREQAFGIGGQAQRLVDHALTVARNEHPGAQEPFRLLVQSLFSFRRKQLARGVRDACAVSAEVAAQLIGRAGLTRTDRPEVLSPGDFARLLRAWRA